MATTLDTTPLAAAPKRILIVDDHALVREGLSEVIRHEPDLLVCGQTDDAFTALKLVESTRPDLALVDIIINGKHGLELIKDLQVQHPEMAVLVFSMHDEMIYAERAIRAGAHGYVMKQESPERLLVAIRHVLAGEIAVSSRVAAKLVDYWARDASVQPGVACLSDRELEIFHLSGLGKDNKAIADLLHISSKTVVSHRARLKAKLHIATTSDLIATAVRSFEH